MLRKIPELEEELKECLKLFPEIKDIDIYARCTGAELNGAFSWYYGKRAIFLFVLCYGENGKLCELL